MRKSLLGGLTARAFLREHWQKRPLLVRGAVPDATDIVDRDGVIDAACRDEVPSRLVTNTRGRWDVRHGPFRKRDLANLPARNWSLLVQDMNHLLPAADALMREFAFLPLARLDDVMVSLAPPGGGVGAHSDSYDVFLLQARGRRRWRVSVQTDLALTPDAPLKLLKRFAPSDEWILKPGDMLYLPPDHAHEGVALDECITCSIGFRAPCAQELAQAFLDHLRDTLDLPGQYRDPDLRPQRNAAAIAVDMQAQAAAMLAHIHWRRHDLDRFLGCYLTEPKSHVVFGPSPSLARARFLERVDRAGLVLSLKSRMLFDRKHLYLNGEMRALSRSTAVLKAFANTGALPPRSRFGAEVADLLYQWYRAGYVKLRTSTRAKGKRK